MTTKSYGLETASDVMKQIITITAVTIGAVLSLLLQGPVGSFGKITAYFSLIFGALSTFSCFLFITEIAAMSLGAAGKPLAFRRWLFIVSWSLFMISVVFASLFVLERIDAI